VRRTVLAFLLLLAACGGSGEPTNPNDADDSGEQTGGSLPTIGGCQVFPAANA